MTQQTINVGAVANDQSGDTLRVAFSKANANFTDLYTQLGSVSVSIPGPYDSDSAAATAGVAVGKPYYQTSGQVFVRRT